MVAVDPEGEGERECRTFVWDMTRGQWGSQSDWELLLWARATPPPAPAPLADWTTATIPELVREITDAHHKPLRNELRRMDVLIRRLGYRHGEVAHFEPEDAFMLFADTIIVHLDHEEEVVFPLSIVVEYSSRRPSEAIPPDCDVTAAIRFMNQGHDDSTDALRRLIILFGKITASTEDSDLILIGNGLAAMLSDLPEHETKEHGILMPAVIFAEEQIRARSSMRNATNHKESVTKMPVDGVGPDPENEIESFGRD